MYTDVSAGMKGGVMFCIHVYSFLGGSYEGNQRQNYSVKKVYSANLTSFLNSEPTKQGGGEVCRWKECRVGN